MQDLFTFYLEWPAAPAQLGIGLPTEYYGPLLVLSSVLMISPLRIKKWG